MDLIRISEMLATMDMKNEDGFPIPFDFTFITCNLSKNTGGKRIACKNVIIVGGSISNSKVKDQDHFKNYTRNFRSADNQEIRQFHPPLVETFNGMKVVL